MSSKSLSEIMQFTLYHKDHPTQELIANFIANTTRIMGMTLMIASG